MVNIVKKLAISVVLILTVAGCSGGDDGDSATPTTGATAAGAAGSTTSLQPVDTRFTGENSAQFCALARTYNDSFTSIGSNPTPAQLRTVAAAGQTAITQAENTAPGEIKNDVQVLARTFGGLISELEKVGFEAAKLPPAALGQLTAPEFQMSTTRFQAYIRTVCGVN